MSVSAPVQSRFIWEISKEIREDWAKPYFGAVPYIDAMDNIRLITDPYYYDTGREMVIRFLSNANTWRGEKARKIKAELKAMAGLK